ncbi:Na(+)/H(+) antiporter subunit B [Sulfurovum sp. CS9]|uniref:Na(+)/H(+) antiporter subunit B n=1 Tax=Sulfurovum sp. CS9 TaxID=3391146 RepID=UPI0039E8719C
MIGFIILVTFIGIVIVAFSAVIQKKLADSVILLMGVGLGSVVLFFIFKAPDVALTEAVIGSGISSLIFLMALKHLGENT